jgi:hypothetical protein
MGNSEINCFENREKRILGLMMNNPFPDHTEGFLQQFVAVSLCVSIK